MHFGKRNVERRKEEKEREGRAMKEGRRENKGKRNLTIAYHNFV